MDTLLNIGGATVENRMEASQNLKIELPYDPVLPLLGIYPKRTKTCASMFIAILSTIAQIWEQPKCPTKHKCMMYT